MPKKSLEKKVRPGHVYAFYPTLPTIIEDPRESEFDSESASGWASYSSEAHSEDWWLDHDSSESDAIGHTVLKNRKDYELYSVILSTTAILQRTEPEEFKYYQAVFDSFLKDYSSYIKNASPSLNEIKIIHSMRNNERVNCCYLFKQKEPTNTVTNKFIILMIDSVMQPDLTSVQKIQEQVPDSQKKISIDKRSQNKK